MLKFLLVVLLIAIAVYAVARVIERRGSTPTPRPRPRQAPPRPMGPDDDPEFLRDLERRRRQKDEPDST